MESISQSKEGLIAGNTPDKKLIIQWEEFINQHPHGTVLQSYATYRLFAATNRFKPFFVYGKDHAGRILGVLLAVHIRESDGLKGRLSSRVVVYGGPLVDPGYPDPSKVVELLISELIRLVSQQSVFIQIRASWDLSSYNQVFRQHGFKWHPRLNRLIDTTDHAQVQKGISASKRRQVKKSLKNGARVIVPENLEQVRKFYLILRDLYRVKVRKPLPDWSFFKSFYDLSQELPFFKIFLVECNAKIIGGIMSPCYPGRAVFEWYVCGLDQDYKPRGIFPSVLATWAAIDHAAKGNYRLFDFMGIGKPGIPYGVRDFKSTFGGDEVNYGRYIRIGNRYLYNFAELGYNILSWIKKV